MRWLLPLLVAIGCKPRSAATTNATATPAASSAPATSAPATQAVARAPDPVLDQACADHAAVERRLADELGYGAAADFLRAAADSHFSLTDPGTKTSFEPLLTAMLAGKRVAADDLKPLASVTLWRLRNAPFARRGRPFKTADLQRFFYTQLKLVPNPKYDDKLLDKDDQANVDVGMGEIHRRGPVELSASRPAPAAAPAVANASCDGREAKLEVASRTSRHGVTIGCGRVDAMYLSFGGGAHDPETWGAAIEPTAYAQLWSHLETLSKQLDGTCKLDDPENDRQSVSLQIPSLKVDFNCAPDAVPEDLGRLIDRVEGAVDEMPPGAREAAQQARYAAANESLFASARQRATDIANGGASVLEGGMVEPLQITVDGDEIEPQDPKAQGFDWCGRRRAISASTDSV